jgi:multisubunit Na+/H+ antiporter MnhC subunit
MEANAFYLIAIIVVLGVALFVIKRVLRLAMKMFLISAVLLVLLAGLGYAWWSGQFASEPKTARRPAAAARPVK